LAKTLREMNIKEAGSKTPLEEMEMDVNEA
jgi:hypothetical protein